MFRFCDVVPVLVLTRDCRSFGRRFFFKGDGICFSVLFDFEGYGYFPKVSNTLNVSVCNPLLSRGRGYMNSPSGISLSAIGL